MAVQRHPHKKNLIAARLRTYNAAMKFIVNLDRDESGRIVAECPAIPGCVSQGKSEAEALSNIREAIQACLEARAANGMPLTVATR